MFTVDFSSHRYVCGQVQFVDEIVHVGSLSEALGLAPSAGHIGLLNQARGYTPEVIKTAWAREECHEAPDEWAGARFECLTT